MPENQELENLSRFKVILLRGMEDLPDTVSGALGKSLGAVSFNSNWFDKEENLASKLGRLDGEVQKAKDVGQEVVLIGVSAGGGLAKSYILKHPGSITHVYSLLGVLDPKMEDPKIKRLADQSSSFKELVENLQQNLTEENIKPYHLNQRITAYSSKGDQTVPTIVSAPPWIETRRVVDHGDHAPTIAKLLLEEMPKQLNILAKVPKNT